MVIDCHVHLMPESLGGCESAKDILRAMDKVGVDKIFLFSPPPVKIELKSRYLTYTTSQEKQRESIERVVKVIEKNPERLTI